MRKLLYLFALTFTITLFISCSDRQGKRLYEAMALTDTEPDSMLALLNTIDRSQLSGKNLAIYSLAYTKAQDKSGLDVDNDSLIGIAYDWYKNRKSDSLYATCQYYMGKYYMLNENTEQAIVCLEDARKYAEIQKDTALECLALGKLSKVISNANQQKALEYAERNVKLNEMNPKTSVANNVYSIISLAENYMFSDSISKAIPLGEKALRMSLRNGDSTLIADVYQDLSIFYDYSGDCIRSLSYAKKSCEYNTTWQLSQMLTVACAYMKVDSMAQAYSILKKIKTNTSSDRYAKYYDLGRWAMKTGNIDSIKTFSDSAYHNLELMYDDALRTKVKYYTTSLKNEEEKAKVQKTALSQRFLFTIISIILLFVIIFIIYAYRNYRKKNLREKEMAEKLHREEIEHREIQLSVMRNFLMKKVDVIGKLNSAKANSPKHILLTEEDWTEIETFLDGADDMFAIRLKKSYPEMSEKDARLMMLLRLKLPQKTLADIYCISEKAVKQKLYLYKTKVGIKGYKTSLREFIEAF